MTLVAQRDARGSTWRLSLLGAWLLIREDVVIDVSTNGRRLLAILAVRGTCDRSYLSGLMWPDSCERLAQANLRATLSRLHRRDLDHLVQSSNGALALSPTVQVDVCRLVQMASAALDGTVRAPYWMALRVLTAGDLLVGWYDEWVLFDRERLRQLRLHGLEALSEHLVNVGNVAAAVEAAMEAVATEPLRESAHRALIRAHLAEGNRAEALRHLAYLRRLLDEELGVEPSALVTNLFC